MIGCWFQTRLDNNETHKLNDPLKQADKSKFRFVELIDTIKGYNQSCYVQSAVWFPSITGKSKFSNLPLSYSKNIILLKEDLDNPEIAINRIYKENNSERNTNMDKAMEKRIIEKLAPEFDLVNAITSEKEEKEYSFLRLTKEQSALLDYLIEQRKVTIQGFAGTGKTLIAIEEAKRLADEGRNVLLLCYNKMLYKQLAKKFKYQNIEYINLHTLIGKFSGNYNVNDIEVLRMLNEIKNKLYYQDIIIDEAQDFDDEIIEFFSNLVDENNGKFYVFYDRNQLIFKQRKAEWLDKSQCKLILSKVCRNTFQIAVTANNILDIEAELPDNNIRGEMPTLSFVPNKEKAIELINSLIEKYKENGFSNSEITILTMSTLNYSIFTGMQYIGNNKLVNEIDNENILFTTSKKFKGLESNIIILVDLDENTFLYEEGKRNFYVGVSRAKQKLDIVSVATEDKINRIASQICNATSNNNAIKIAKKLKVRLLK